MNKSRVLLCASSSGGHINPAIALGTELKRHGHLVKYLGIKGEIEEKLIAKEDLIALEIAKSFKNFVKDVKHYPLEIKEFRKLNNLIENFDVIVGCGGFITFVASCMPKIKGKRLILHEQNVPLGDALKFSLKRADDLIFSFDESKLEKKPKKLKVHYLGNPSGYLMKRTTEIPKKKTILFVSGSLGSTTLLELAINTALLLSQYQITIISGTKYYEKAKKMKKSANVTIISYGKMDELFATHELIIMRAGGSSIAEVIEFGRPLILIPSPYVKHNHQHLNASYLALKGGCVEMQETQLNPYLLKSEIVRVIEDEKIKEMMKNVQREIKKSTSCEDIVQLIEKYD